MVSHTQEELSTLKYSELQKIAKSLHLKCGRTKAEKLIQSILKQEKNSKKEDDIQNLEGDIEMLQDTEPLKSADEVDTVQAEEPKVPEKKRRRRRKKNSKSVEKKISKSPMEASKPGRLSRSRTFELPDTSSPQKTSPSKALSPRPKLSRSNTFEIETPKSPAKKRKRSSGVDDQQPEENSPAKSVKFDKPRSPLKAKRSLKKIKSPDLLCKEKQSITDIEEVEKASTPPQSPLKTSSKFSSRKSLRGQLLASRLKNRVARMSQSPKVDPKPSTSYPDKRRSSSASLKSSPVKEEKTSIPRFVKYALSMPDFSKIHAKQFRKMESVDDYVQRKTEKIKDANKSISATPKPKTPFKPTVTSVKNIKTNFAAMPPTKIQESSRKENTPVKKPKLKGEWGKNTTAMDSPGSFKRRSQYKPKTTVTSNAQKAPSNIPVSKPVSRREDMKVLANRNPVVKSKAQRRDNQKNFLKGVRLNKRFALQMAKRGISYTQDS